MVFQQVGLEEGPHTFSVQVASGSVLLLDYIVYTQDSLFGSVDNGPASAGLGINATTSSLPVGMPSSTAGSSPCV